MTQKFGIQTALELLDTIGINDNAFDELELDENERIVSVEPVLYIPTVSDIRERMLCDEPIILKNDVFLGKVNDLIQTNDDEEDQIAIGGDDENKNKSNDDQKNPSSDIKEPNDADDIETDHYDNEKDTDYQAKTTEEDSSESEDEHGEKVRSRKRKRNEKEWAKNVRRRRRQSGNNYKDVNGRQRNSRSIKPTKDCGGLCKFRCYEYFTQADRECLLTEFWKLSDSEKYAYYARTTTKNVKSRTRTNNKNSRRSYSYQYFLWKDNELVKVCKQFYLTTLDISQRRIEWFYNKNPDGNTSFTDLRGTKTTTRKSSRPTSIEYLKQHIQSFPTVPSHYCRAGTHRRYLDPGLTIQKMYQLYQEKCKTDGIAPLKLSYYRRIFNFDFNLGFHVPKKDKCDTCEANKHKQESEEMSDETKHKFDEHIKRKTETKEERDQDRKNGDKVVVCFDMQNVLTCPRANVSNFFYKRKLTVFNLTAHCSLDKVAYNAVWVDRMAGRGANEIASALTLILNEICHNHPNIHEITLWSDSCVPQNRNSIMVTALRLFLKSHPSVKSIEHKFCTPGHSCIQEVDNEHSHIEKALRIAEIYSPISLIRVLLKVRPKHMQILQMKNNDMFDFQRVAEIYKFSHIPFKKLNYLKINLSNSSLVWYKCMFSGELQEAVSDVKIRHTNVPKLQVLNKL